MPRPFPSLRSSLSLITDADSTRWPGATRFAVSLQSLTRPTPLIPALYQVHILLLCLLIAIAQFGISLAYGIQLLRLGHTVLCETGEDNLAYGDDVRPLPVTFANGEKMDRMEYLSMHRNRSKQ